MKSHLTIPIAVLVAALLCCLRFWNQATDASRQEAVTTRTVHSTGHLAADSSPRVPTKLPRPAKTTRTTAPASHSPEQLKDFIIPNLKLEGIPLEEALQALLDAYAEICEATGESPVRFTFTVNGSPANVVNLNLSQVSFLSALRLVATQSGMTLERHDSSLALTAIEVDPDAPLITSAVSVPPDFVYALQQLLDPEAYENSLDPFAPPQETPNPTALLRRLGLLQEEETSASYLAGTSTLITRGNPTDTHHLRALLDELSRSPQQLKTQIKLIETTADMEIPLGSISDSDYQELIRTIAQQKGVDIMTTPSLTSRPGQQGTIAVGNNRVREDPNVPGVLEDAWLGLRFDVSAGGYGFDLRKSGTFSQSTLKDDHPDSEISRKEVSYEGIQPNGSTMIVKTESSAGNPLYMFITTQQVDPGGKPAGSDQIPTLTEPLPPSPKKLDPLWSAARPALPE